MFFQLLLISGIFAGIHGTETVVVDVNFADRNTDPLSNCARDDDSSLEVAKISKLRIVRPDSGKYALVQGADAEYSCVEVDLPQVNAREIRVRIEYYTRDSDLRTYVLILQDGTPIRTLRLKDSRRKWRSLDKRVTVRRDSRPVSIRIITLNKEDDGYLLINSILVTAQISRTSTSTSTSSTPAIADGSADGDDSSANTAPPTNENGANAGQGSDNSSTDASNDDSTISDANGNENIGQDNTGTDEPTGAPTTTENGDTISDSLTDSTSSGTSADENRTTTDNPTTLTSTTIVIEDTISPDDSSTTSNTDSTTAGVDDDDNIELSTIPLDVDYYTY